MTLGFSTKINGKPNFFVEKIWKGIVKRSLTDLVTERKFLMEARRKYSLDIGIVEFEKLHTIRLDSSDRWKVGMKIHLVINNRTKDRFQFAPVLECKSVQTIEIKHVSLTIPRGETRPVVFIDGKLFYDMAAINIKQMRTLALNDGFSSIEDFFAYFNTDFKGKIIHWTDLKY